MKIPDHLEIELYPNQPIETKVVIQSSYSKKIRGSNFKDQATFFIDSNHSSWLWKDLPLLSMVREYIVSFLAFELGIRVPRSIIAKRGHSIGLIQEWIDSEDLTSFSNNQQALINKTELFDLFVFEAWIGALDRHGGNYLTSCEGQVWAIDYEKSFSDNIQGSELCLYYPWIKDSENELKKSIKKLIDKISLLEITNKLFNLANFPKDQRAREALSRYLAQIFELLKNNLTHLYEIVDAYLEKSFSQPEFILNT
ncbi:MAG: hypothetical protein ACXADY_08360 [Candidatus Hodarchaeales archaeon]|jgi:uncharacterized protein YozE (UPF0346 family)